MTWGLGHLSRQPAPAAPRGDWGPSGGDMTSRGWDQLLGTEVGEGKGQEGPGGEVARLTIVEWVRVPFGAAA